MGNLFQKNVESLPIDATQQVLLDLVMTKIHAMGYFRSVVTALRDLQAVSTPIAIVWPRGDAEIPEGVSNLYSVVDYRFEIGIGLRQGDDYILSLQVCSIRSRIRNAFHRLTCELPGFIQTLVEVGNISSPELVPQGPILFGTGLALHFHIQTQGVF